MDRIKFKLSNNSSITNELGLSSLILISKVSTSSLLFEFIFDSLLATIFSLDLTFSTSSTFMSISKSTYYLLIILVFRTLDCNCNCSHFQQNINSKIHDFNVYHIFMPYDVSMVFESVLSK